MKRNSISWSGILFFVFGFSGWSATAVAGPPLVCNPISIGNARSLPWSSSTRSGWNEPRSDYDTRKLADDTIALLDEASPVIVRMETLRRATVYGMRDPAAAQDVLDRIRARALGKSAAKDTGLALFDYGYLIETMKQGWGTKDLRDRSGPAKGLEGYPYIQHALQIRPGDVEMEFAAALVTGWPKMPSQEEHFRKALAAADSDPLLHENLLSHFSSRGKTLAEMREGVNLMAKKN